MPDFNYQHATAPIGSYDAKAAYDSPEAMGPFQAAGHTFEAVYALIRRLEVLADRLTGSGPQQAAGSSGQAVATPPMPLFTALHVEANKAASAVQDGHAALERIERQIS